MSQKIIISHNNSDLYKTATYASNYAKELRAEIAPLINRLSVDYPQKQHVITDLLMNWF